MRRRRPSRALAAVLLLGLVGCARWRSEPAELPFPDPPAVHFFLCGADHVCLSQADADRLAKWMDKLRAFQAARERLLHD